MKLIPKKKMSNKSYLILVKLEILAKYENKLNKNQFLYSNIPKIPKNLRDSEKKLRLYVKSSSSKNILFILSQISYVGTQT